MNNLLSYCGLTDASMRAPEKDLPVNRWFKLKENSLCKFTGPNCTLCRYDRHRVGAVPHGLWLSRCLISRNVRSQL